MIELTPIAITATSHQYMMTLSEGLCPPQCVNDANQPTVELKATAKSIVNPDGEVAQVTTHVSGTIIWTPQGSRNAVVRQISEVFTDGFAGAAVPSVAYTVGTSPIATLRRINCCNSLAKSVVITAPLTIAATFPS